MKKNQDVKHFLMRYRYVVGIAVFCLILIPAAVFGQQRVRKQRAAVQESIQAESVRQEAEESRRRELEASRAAEESEAAEIDALLSGEMREVYQELFQALSDERYDDAARCLERNKGSLKEFASETLKDEMYLYDGTTLKKTDQGYGLLVNKSGTACLGSWKSGVPDGTGTVLRTLVLEEARYDISKGQWKEGKLDGDGLTGYCYYHGVEEPRTREIWKQGTFRENLMTGEVTYTSVNASGGETVWKLKVQEGKTVLDERWRKTEDGSQFRLSAETDELHDYVLSSEKMDEVLWKNMVEWK